MTFPFASRQQDGRRGSDHCRGHCEPEHVRLHHQSLNLHLVNFCIKCAKAEQEIEISLTFF